MLKDLIYVRLSVAMDSLQETRLVTITTGSPEMDAVPRALWREVSLAQDKYVDCRDVRAGYAEMAKSLLEKKALQNGIAMTEIFSPTMGVIPLAALSVVLLARVEHPRVETFAARSVVTGCLWPSLRAVMTETM